MSRAQTVVLALLIMNFLLGALCLAAARGERSVPALRLWGWGTLIYAAGLAITMQRWMPAAVGLTLGNALIAWSPIIIVEGVLANTDFRLKRRWAYAALVLVIAILVYGNSLAEPLSLINLVAPTPIAIVLFLLGAYQLLRKPPSAARVAARFLAGTMLFAVAVWSLRIAFIWNIASVNNDRDSVDLVISLFAIAQIVVAVACTMALFWIEVRKMEMVLTRVAFTDSLTELPNRRAIIQRFKEEESQAVRHGKQFALLILDIDHFKQFNDRYGHLTGDAVLRHVADCLARTRRAGDALGRMGGEEFVMLLAGDLLIAQGAAERLRAQVEEDVFHCRGATLSVTVSGGLAMFPGDGVDWDQLFSEADRRLYVSKQNGRNRITASSATNGRGPPAMT
ncbi:MAG: GGDEF domain-containing protein, partial [Betaproteobacteria bacterium]